MAWLSVLSWKEHEDLHFIPSYQRSANTAAGKEQVMSEQVLTITGRERGRK